MQSGLIYKKLSRNEWLIFAVIAVAAVLSFVALDAGAQGDGLAHVYFLDVGQGDAQLIAFNGNQILIDGGPDNQILQELGRVMPFNDKTIEAVILTHPDADHINGLINVLERYKVENIVENFLDKHDSAVYRKWNEFKKEATVTQATYGQKIELGNGAYLEIIYPINPESEQSKTNNNSVISRLTYGENQILFTGDTEAKIEKELIARKIDIDADFLKIPHHGSRTSTSEELLEAVTPESAFIQVGKDNRYGHPHSVVLERLESRGIKYYRTDTNGLIELILDGQEYKISTTNK